MGIPGQGNGYDSCRESSDDERKVPLDIDFIRKLKHEDSPGKGKSPVKSQKDIIKIFSASGLPKKIFESITKERKMVPAVFFSEDYRGSLNLENFPNNIRRAMNPSNGSAIWGSNRRWNYGFEIVKGEYGDPDKKTVQFGALIRMGSQFLDLSPVPSGKGNSRVASRLLLKMTPKPKDQYIQSNDGRMLHMHLANLGNMFAKELLRFSPIKYDETYFPSNSGDRVHYTDVETLDFTLNDKQDRPDFIRNLGISFNFSRSVEDDFEIEQDLKHKAFEVITNTYGQWLLGARDELLMLGLSTLVHKIDGDVGVLPKHFAERLIRWISNLKVNLEVPITGLYDREQFETVVKISVKSMLFDLIADKDNCNTDVAIFVQKALDGNITDKFSTEWRQTKEDPEKAKSRYDHKMERYCETVVQELYAMHGDFSDKERIEIEKECVPRKSWWNLDSGIMSDIINESKLFIEFGQTRFPAKNKKKKPMIKRDTRSSNGVRKQDRKPVPVPQMMNVKKKKSYQSYDSYKKKPSNHSFGDYKRSGTFKRTNGMKQMRKEKAGRTPNGKTSNNDRGHRSNRKNSGKKKSNTLHAYTSQALGEYKPTMSDLVEFHKWQVATGRKMSSQYEF